MGSQKNLPPDRPLTMITPPLGSPPWVIAQYLQKNYPTFNPKAYYQILDTPEPAKAAKVKLIPLMPPPPPSQPDRPATLERVRDWVLENAPCNSTQLTKAFGFPKNSIACGYLLDLLAINAVQRWHINGIYWYGPPSDTPPTPPPWKERRDRGTKSKILAAVEEGPKTFHELKTITGVSTTTLEKHLPNLVAEGVLTRTEIPTGNRPAYTYQLP